MKKINRSSIILYCLPLFAVGLFTTMLNNYLIYFYQPTAAPGHRDGRRIPFLRRYAVPFALCALLIFCSPFQSPLLNDIWLAVFIWAYYIFYTLYMVPHSALLPELVREEGLLVDSYTWHSLFFVVGSMLGYATPAIVALIKKTGIPAISAWRLTFLAFTAVGVALLLVPTLVIREKDYVRSVRPTAPLATSLKHAFSNRHFRLVTLGQLFEGTGMSFFQACIMYYITELMGIPEEQSIIIMATSIVGSLVLYPVINKWSKRSGKKLPMIVGCVVFAAAEFVICFVDIFPQSMATAVAFALFVSFPFAVLNILPGSMMADVIRYDTVITGVNQEGTFAAAKSFVTKLGTSIATMIVPSLVVVGAMTGQSVGRKGLLLTAVVGGVFTLISVVIYAMYDEKKIRRVIRQAGKEAAL